MRFRRGQLSNVVYLAFCIPFILAYLSWAYFPLLAEWLITNTFNYRVLPHPSSQFWYATIRFFYAWYTFLAIAVAGVWAVAAILARKHNIESCRSCYPMVSFVVPAYEEEENISRCINSLFQCTDEYDGLCELIVVDDGS
ncbi:MAG: glycosyltransferase, partial [Candidatus Hodarchaeota archaeon]